MSSLLLFDLNVNQNVFPAIIPQFFILTIENLVFIKIWIEKGKYNNPHNSVTENVVYMSQQTSHIIYKKKPQQQQKK